jgi:hypothetical protein
VILARAPSVKSLTVRNKLDLRAVVAVCWNCDTDSHGERRTNPMVRRCRQTIVPADAGSADAYASGPNLRAERW